MKSMKSAWIWASLVVALGGAGCLDILGFKDPVLAECEDTSCAGSGGGQTSSGGNGGATNSGGTGGSGAGGTGGTGGTTPFACTPAGGVFDIFSEADIVGADVVSNEFFIVSDDTGPAPRAHVLSRVDLATGTMVVRTVKGMGALGSVVSWSPPVGSSRYVEGYASAEEVVILGHFTGMNGPTAAEIHIAKGADEVIPSGAVVTPTEYEHPTDCEAGEEAIAAAFFSRSAGETYYMVTQDCADETRRLYLGNASGPQLVRSGMKGDVDLELSGFAHVGSGNVAVFSKNAESGYSQGANVVQLADYKPVVLSQQADAATASLGILTPSSNAGTLFWATFSTQTTVPVDIVGAALSAAQLGEVGSAAAYTKVAHYEENTEVTSWTNTSFAGGKILTGGLDGAATEARFSVISATAAPLSIDNVATKGPPGSIGSVAVGAFGDGGVLVAWRSVNENKFSIRGRLFACQ